MTHRPTLCSQVEETISTYLDGELSPLEATGVESHLESCPSCQEIFASLSEVASVLQEEGRSTPAPPPWSSVAARARKRSKQSRPTAGKLFALAASLLVVAGAGWLLTTRPPSNGRSELAVQPAGSGAEREALPVQMAGLGLPGLDDFLTRHRAVEVDPPQLEQHLSFAPRVPDRLPGGFRVVRAYLIEDRCCAGVCFLYRDREDRLVGLVQQPPSHPFEWQDAQLVRQQVGGTFCRRASLPAVELTQIDPEGRNLTLVVARGFAASDELVRYLASR